MTCKREIILLYVVWKDVVYPKINIDEELVNDDDDIDDDDDDDQVIVGASPVSVNRHHSYPIERRQRAKRGRRQLNLDDNNAATTSQPSTLHWTKR